MSIDDLMAAAIRSGEDICFVSLRDTTTVHFVDDGCHVGSIRRIIIGTTALEFEAVDRVNDVLVWRQRP